MYALARNSGKYKSRDKRKNKIQNIEYDALAPDTIEEIINACRLLEIWTAKAWLLSNSKLTKTHEENELADIGRELLMGSEDKIKKLEVLGENMERSNRKVVIIKVFGAYHAYRDMLLYYSVKNLIAYFQSDSKANVASMNRVLKGTRTKKWVNLGGQLIPEKDVDQLRTDIGSGRLNSWSSIHNRYNELWKTYRFEKQQHAYSLLYELFGTNKLTKELWISAIEKSIKIQEYVSDQVYISRKKDFDNKFRQATFRNVDEMTASIGTIEENDFVKQVREETKEYRKLALEIKNRG